jgi:hypothetical protein
MYKLIDLRLEILAELRFDFMTVREQMCVSNVSRTNTHRWAIKYVSLYTSMLMSKIRISQMSKEIPSCHGWDSKPRGYLFSSLPLHQQLGLRSQMTES